MCEFGQLFRTFDRSLAKDGSSFLRKSEANRYWHQRFEEDDHLVFGRETKGLPESLLAMNASHCLTIPMREEARSLNLATAAGIVLYEAVRQLRIF